MGARLELFECHGLPCDAIENDPARTKFDSLIHDPDAAGRGIDSVNGAAQRALDVDARSDEGPRSGRVDSDGLADCEIGDSRGSSILSDSRFRVVLDLETVHADASEAGDDAKDPSAAHASVITEASSAGAGAIAVSVAGSPGAGPRIPRSPVPPVPVPVVIESSSEAVEVPPDSQFDMAGMEAIEEANRTLAITSKRPSRSLIVIARTPGFVRDSGNGVVLFSFVDRIEIRAHRHAMFRVLVVCILLPEFERPLIEIPSGIFKFVNA
jgi:hypothetical protein